MEQIWCVSRGKVESGQGAAESKVQPVGCRLMSPRQKFRTAAVAADEDKRLGAKVHTRELIYKFGEKISYYSRRIERAAARASRSTLITTGPVR
jgi:hypothetical protein